MSMNADDLIAFLQPHFPEAFIQAANQGNKFDVRVVDASFEGKRLVQRQQAVYGLVGDIIASGEIHHSCGRASLAKGFQSSQWFG